jgi:hypothetical protein
MGLRFCLSEIALKNHPMRMRLIRPKPKKRAPKYGRREGHL